MASVLGGLYRLLTGDGSGGKQGRGIEAFGLDVAIEEDLSVFESERVQVNERGELTGLAATIGKDALELRDCKLPAAKGQSTSPNKFTNPVRMKPTFENNTQILKIAKCVCRVLIEEGGTDGKQRRHFFATAFFVSETRLLTAGHNIAGVNDRVTRISISLPGVSYVVSTDMSLHNVPLIDCKVVGTLYKRDGHYSKDLAILDSGSFRNPDYVPLSSIIPPKEAVIDIIGYPGQIRREWIQAQWGMKNLTKGEQDTKKLLPAGSLLVTRGTVEDSEETMSYHISTSPGMGGSCVMYQGSVIAVHIGQSERNIQNLTMAVSFTGAEVPRFLRKYGVKVS